MKNNFYLCPRCTQPMKCTYVNDRYSSYQCQNARCEGFYYEVTDEKQCKKEKSDEK